MDLPRGYIIIIGTESLGVRALLSFVAQMVDKSAMKVACHACSSRTPSVSLEDVIRRGR